MSDRLQELLRQRQLVQEQLAWLDREIVTVSGDAPPSPPSPPAPMQAPDLSRPTPPPSNFVASQAAAIARHAAAACTPRSDESPQVIASADAILDQYRVQPDSLKTNVSRGCLLYFFCALAGVAVVVTGLYYALRK